MNGSDFLFSLYSLLLGLAVAHVATGFADSWVEHARHYTNKMIDRFGFGAHSHVIELASNDGYLLQWFVKAGVPVLGIDPTANTAAAAEKKGVRTLVKFFGVDTAKGKEGMVVVAEARAPEGSTDLAPLRAQVQERVKAVAGIPAKDVVLVSPGTLPKTSSGKLQRAQCRARYLAGHLELVSV